VHVYRLTPPTVAPEHRDHLLVHVHGGGFVQGAGLAGTAEAIGLARAPGVLVLAVDYRMPPDHPAPAARDDVVAVWREVVKGRPAAATALGGTSAGANLALVATSKLKELGAPLPGALILGSPPVDLAKHGDSRFLNEGVDRRLVTWDGHVAAAVALYAGSIPLDDPGLSPIYGDLDGFPPSYLVTGTRDLLLSDTVLVHRKLRRAGVEADLNVYEGQSHADFVLAWDTPEAREHLREVDAFLVRHLAR
jgi:acetyl esterase/lipase